MKPSRLDLIAPAAAITAVIVAVLLVGTLVDVETDDRQTTGDALAGVEYRVDELEADVRALGVSRVRAVDDVARLEQRVAELEAALFRTDTRVNRSVTTGAADGSRYEAAAAPAGDAWLAMAACESTGDDDGVAPHRIDKRATSPGGRYGGALQWDLTADPPTWQQAGGTGDPRDATLDEELARGAAWAARTDIDAAGQWPTCWPAVGRRLGIPR